MSEPRQPLRILHTAAHPADSFDMVGGTLAHHIERGDHVTVVAFSHGVRSHALTTIAKSKEAPAKSAAVAADIDHVVDEKEQEVRDGCAVLGIKDVRFLRLDDDLLLTTEEHVRTVARIIREVRPDVLITHSPFEMAGISVAHRACCEIALLARSMAHGLMKGEDSPPHTIPEIFFVHQHGETTLLDYAGARFPQIIIDVTDVIERKVRAMDCLKSQYYPGALGRKIMEVVGAGQAAHLRVPYGESFLRYYPDVQYFLPVSEHNIRMTREPQEQTYKRLGKMIAPHVPFNGEILR
jgi:4-oxalomesaconate hydratase